MLHSASEGDALPPTPARKPLYSQLYVQVLTAITIGVLLGHFYPDIGVAMKPLGDGFIKLIKMIIVPVIFCTVVHGIASMSNLKAVGSTGIKALVYFEVVTTLALIVGLVVANVIRPGEGMNVDPTKLDSNAVSAYVTTAKGQTTIEFLLDIIPKTVVGAFADGNILQVLLVAILFAFALQALGPRGKLVLELIDQTSH
uniref:cation:dicarboxylate symporter family transporter n=1 Tax=Parvibaculum sp. TaxID=2024848 RepID=UPI003BACA1E2